MRSLTVKTICNDSGSLPRTIKAPDKSTLGNNSDASRQTRRINNIPDDISDAQVIHLFETTCDISWLGGKKGRLEFDFSELGEGNIIRA